MTIDDRRAALVEKVAAEFRRLTTVEFARGTPHTWEELATAAISLIRAEVLEEAAKHLWDEGHFSAAAAIRALKDKT